MLQLAADVDAWYAHLQPGSITVAVGGDVEAGTPLGKLGNGGPSLGPHLHFGLLDAPDPFTGASLPFVIDEYTLAATVDLAASTGEHLVTTPRGERVTKAYPLYGGIQDFP
jgi:murein DD-endopeptidase MepM/ murein hydrolase activator NlpD